MAERPELGHNSHGSTARQRAPRKTENGSVPFREVLSHSKKRSDKGSADKGAKVNSNQQMTASEELALLQSMLQLDGMSAGIFSENQTARGVLGTSSGAAALQAQVPQLSPEQAMRFIAEKSAGLQEQRKLRIDLNPDHLGPLVVELRMNNGRLRASLLAKSPEACRLLASGSDRLQRALQEMGFSDAEVVVEQRQAEFFGGGADETEDGNEMR